MNGKRKRWILGMLLVYGAALLLLVATERNAEGATIRSLGDALWYSLVTMTTVGYGDLSPVTVPGRVISILFLAMSIGLFGLLLQTVYSFTTGRLVPRVHGARAGPKGVGRGQTRPEMVQQKMRIEHRRGGLIELARCDRGAVFQPDLQRFDPAVQRKVDGVTPQPAFAHEQLAFIRVVKIIGRLEGAAKNGTAGQVFIQVEPRAAAEREMRHAAHAVKPRPNGDERRIGVSRQPTQSGVRFC